MANYNTHVVKTDKGVNEKFEWNCNSSFTRYLWAPTYTKSVVHKEKISHGSPRVNGVFKPRENAHLRHHYRAYSSPGIVVNDMSTARCYYSACPSGYTHTSSWIPQGTLGVPVSKSPDYNGVAENRANLKLRKQTLESKVNIAVALRERQQTIDMIGNAARSLVSMMRGIRRGRLRLPNSLDKEAANRFLELKYGWQPLYSDIYGALIATVDKPLFFPASGSGVFTDNLPATKRHCKGNIEIKDRVTYKALWAVTDPMSVKANELGMLNPALIAWELVPFSFVVDWMLPVGGWLESMTAFVGLSAVDSSRTGTREITWKYTSDYPYPSTSCTNIVYSAQPYKEEGHSKYKHRVLRVLPGFPSLSVQNPLSVDNALSSLALLRQQSRATFFNS